MATLGDKMNLFPPLIKLVWSKWINFNYVLYFYIYLNCDSYLLLELLEPTPLKKVHDCVYHA